MEKNKLCLGTVQFGMEYGINNTYGKPSQAEVFRMLDEAMDKGIGCLDTAAAYGDAEELLGKYGISRHNVEITTKLTPKLIVENDPNTDKIVQLQIEQSLQKLKVEHLDGYLLHTPTDFYNERIIEALQKCKEKELIGHFGVSIYETEQAMDVVRSGVVDYIQVPYSVLDQRVDKNDFFELAKRNNVTVFARSAFLQGLICMEEDKIPAHLGEVKIYLREFDRIITKYNFSRMQAAFLFSYTHPDIDYLVFGVDNVEQLWENIELSTRKFEFQACREEISGSFSNMKKSIIFPSLWKK